MISQRLAMAAAFCALATTGALAQQGTVSLPQIKPAPQVAPTPASPPPQQPEWSKQDIELAQARCTALLKNLDVVVVPATPWREGQDCGAAAPMKLISIGKGQQQVTLSPPVTVTCDLIAALHKWVQGDLQPLAKKHLGGPLVRIEAMSAYSCRNAYGRAKTRLSEHARANALDIGSFVTAKGQKAAVVADWGMTAREIQAQIAAAKAEQAKAAAGEPVKQEPTVAAPHTPPSQPAIQAGQPAFTITIPGITVQPPGNAGHATTFGFAPSKLGGPKGDITVDANGSVPNGKMDFLRAAHRAACKIFGTVLGPEANKEHKNHFHVDMADRKGGFAVCE
jgi:hypothetical protein